MQDLHNRIKVLTAIIPQTQTNADTAIVGEIIDTSGFDSVEFAVALGVVTDADVTVAVTMEHGDDSGLSDTAAPAAGDIVGSANFTFADDKGCKKFGYLPKSNPRKRYLRITATPTGNNSGALPIAAVAILSSARTKPTT